MPATKPQRFFVDCHVFDGGFQGTRTYIKGLYGELFQDQTKHFFLAANDVARLESEFGKHSNVTFVRYKTTNKIWRLLIETPRLLLKYKIDYAHFQYRVPPVKVCKYLVTTHDVLFEDFPEYFPKMNRLSSLLTYKFSAKRSDVVFTVSDYSKTEIASYLKVKTAIVMPNGVDQVFFDAYDKDIEKQQVKTRYRFENYLIYISRLEPRKNQHLLLRHFVSLKLYERMQLVFVGHETFANPELSRIKSQLPHQAQSKVHFLEHVSFADMLGLLRASQAFVYPSVAEGFGIPPLEAAAAKIPVLCSRATAMSDFGFFGDNLFDPFNEDEFRQKLWDIATGTSSTTELQKISAHISQNYNWKNAALIFNRAIK